MRGAAASVIPPEDFGSGAFCSSLGVAWNEAAPPAASWDEVDEIFRFLSAREAAAASASASIHGEGGNPGGTPAYTPASYSASHDALAWRAAASLATAASAAASSHPAPPGVNGRLARLPLTKSEAAPGRRAKDEDVPEVPASSSATSFHPTSGSEDDSW